MKLLISSGLLGLIWFAVANILASALAWVIASSTHTGHRRGAGLPLTIRLLPAAASSVFVLGIFFPAHWRFEPADTDESLGLVLAALATFGAFLLLRSAWRAGQIVRTDLRLSMLTRQAATPLAASTEAGAYEVDGLPGVSLAGILRPRILVGSAAVAALTPAELDAAISHEVAHQRSRDNLKRFLIYCAPDVFGWCAAARRLEEAWQAEAECQADARAVRGDERRAVVLASALVKVARLTRHPGLIVPSAAWSAFHVPNLLETRVARLVSGGAVVPGGFGRLRGALLVCALGIPAAAWILNLSYSLHLVTELMVMQLP